MAESELKGILSSVGQIPIDAYYYCRVNPRSKGAAQTVILLTRKLEEIGTFRVADPAILDCLTEVVRRRGKYTKP